MSRRKRGGISPSLFPFLAVLVCTLGTLILLLALVAQDATDNAQQHADSQRAKTAGEKSPKIASSNVPVEPAEPRLAADVVAKMIEEGSFRVSQLVAFRDKQTADLEARRDQMGHLDDHVARLKKELSQLSTEVDRVAGDQPIESVEDAVLVSYRTKIKEESDKIEKLKSESNNRTPRVVIVPHKGPNGTDRRPIYLECNADSLTIWPEGTRITLRQLENSDDVANPLDAALRVVRNHAMKTYGDTAPPYPLLVLRPDGIETYGAARSAMEEWDDQFGYELVPASLKLAYNSPDPNLKRELETTIAKAVANQRPAMIAGRGNGGGGSENESGGGRPRVLSAASLDRASRSNGYYTDRGSEDFGTSTRPSSSYNPSSSGQSALGSATSNGYTGNNAAGSANGYTGAGTYVQTNPNAIDPQTEKRWADDMQTAAQEMKSDGFGPASLNSAMGDPFAGTAGTPGGQGSTGMAVAQSLSDSKQLAQSGQSAAGTKDQSMQGQPGMSGESGKFGEAGQPNAQGQSGSPNSNSAATSRISAGTTGNGGQQSAGSQSAGQAAAQDGADANSQQASPQIQMNATPSRELVKRKGRDWALPKEIAGVGGNAIVRTIRVQCYEDRYILIPPSTGGATEVFAFLGGDFERATMELATSVRDRVDRWGVALPGGRWQPRLDVEVMPGAENRFMQLRSLMDGSGVDVSGRGSL